MSGNSILFSYIIICSFTYTRIYLDKISLFLVIIFFYNCHSFRLDSAVDTENVAQNGKSGWWLDQFILVQKVKKIKYIYFFPVISEVDQKVDHVDFPSVCNSTKEDEYEDGKYLV